MELNREDGGTRRWILCNIDEKVKENSAAQKAGFDTIDEISRLRIVKAGEKIRKRSTGSENENEDLGFKHYFIREPEVVTLERIEKFDPNERTLIASDMVSPFKFEANSGIETLLTTWLIDDGFRFGENLSEVELAGYKAHYAKDLGRLYLIDEKNWTSESLKALLNQIGKNELDVKTVVIYGYSFTFESLIELKNNLKNLLDRNVTVITRY
jgi:adenine-specific DNA-methyltransferase